MLAGFEDARKRTGVFVIGGILVALLSLACFTLLANNAYADTASDKTSATTASPAPSNASANNADNAASVDIAGTPTAGTQTSGAQIVAGTQPVSTQGTVVTQTAVGEQAANAVPSKAPTASAAEPVKSKPVKKPTKAGWLKDVDGTWYYFKSPTAKPSTGWLKTGGKWYYLDPANNGAMLSNTFFVNNGKKYYVSSSGVMKTGWIKYGGGWYYANPSGSIVKSGWKKIGGKWYWFQADKDGLMASSQWITDKNKQYYLTSSGAMKTGWIKKSDGWYYLNKSGAKVKNGWINVDGKWYWLQGDQDGLMLANAKKTINNAYYAFGSSGAMKANCQVDMANDTVGYATNSGKIVRIGVKKNGELVLTDKTGKILTGWQKMAGRWFYGTAGTGVAKKGWLKLGKTWYYFNDQCAMVTGSQTIKGKTNLFNKSGAWLGTSAIATKAQGYSSGSPWLILVDRSAHQVGIFKGSKGNWNQTKLISCVTGAPGSPTITGTFKTNGSKRMSLSTDSRARWCTNIKGGYFFHTILASASELGHSLSHGCIRLAVPDAQWIYRNIGAGTTVVIYN